MEPYTYSSLSRIMIRGFTAADQDDMRNGLVDRSFTFVPLDNVDRIEVLNGLSDFFNGFTEPGGYVNYITQQPPSCFRGSLETGVYNGGIFYGREQVGGPIPETGSRLFSEFLGISPAFRVLNGWINPTFNRLRDSLISGAEKAEAKKFAETTMKSSGEASEN